jgi:ankyrin repeat protein
MLDNQPSENKRFDFENDLILGPVYKRVLFARLCTTPAISEVHSKGPVLPSTQNGPNQCRKEAPDEGLSQPEVESEPIVRVTFEGGEDWSPENIVRILRTCGGFSIGVVTDLEELRRTEDGSRLPKRSLPLASILKQNELVPAGQAFVNAKLILGATLDDADQVAQALDEGAEINTVSEEGYTALQISLGESQTSTAAALILLYNETRVHVRDGIGDTLLHYAMKSGNVSLIRRLVTTMDDLRVFDGEGATPLHVAARGGVDRLTALREINRIFAGQEVCADMVLDHEGRSALHIAAQRGHPEHALELLRLGCDPSFIPKPNTRPQEAQAPSSPLYLAVSRGYVDLVEKVLEECSEMLDLVNWKHHIRHTLLDCVKDSHLKQRYALAELLISHGADWRQTWRQSDRLLEFANTGATPKLLLTLISQGCFPMLRDLDITPSLSGLLDKSHRELAATILFHLHSTESNAVGTSLRPSFYARLGGANADGMSAFTERISLDEILEQIMTGKTSQQIKDNVALTHDERATDALISAKVAFQANPTALGQAFYHMDRYALNDTEKATHEVAAKHHILSIFGHNKPLRALALS